jgi:hypothetical protein
MQPVEPGDAGKPQREVEALLQAARAAFAARQMRKALDALHAAHALAAAHGLHRRAAELKRGMTILGNGGTPKILTRAEGTAGD